MCFVRAKLTIFRPQELLISVEFNKNFTSHCQEVTTNNYIQGERGIIYSIECTTFNIELDVVRFSIYSPRTRFGNLFTAFLIHQATPILNKSHKFPLFQFCEIHVEISRAKRCNAPPKQLWPFRL